AEKLGWGSREFPNSTNSQTIAFTRSPPWLRDAGLYNKNSFEKRVPPWVFKGDRQSIAHFLAAYFGCDGHVSRRSRDRYDIVIAFYSVSRELLEETQHLLLRLGIRAWLCRKNGRYRGAHHASWRLTITSQDDAA